MLKVEDVLLKENALQVRYTGALKMSFQFGQIMKESDTNNLVLVEIMDTKRW